MAALLVAALTASDLAAQDPVDFRAWSDTTVLVLNTTTTGANIPAHHFGFPLLVRLDRSRFDFASARGDGRDIRFASLAGIPYAHQVERWDSARGRAEVWVYLDTLKGNSSSQTLRMYSGNPAASRASDPAAVFPPTNGLLGVWHMGDAGSGGQALRANSVPGGNAAAPSNFDGDESREGVIGLCDSLDGGAPGDYLDIGDGFADFRTGFTWSAWVHPSAYKQWIHLLDLGNAVGPEPEMRGQDNIIVGREDLSDHLAVHSWGPDGVHSHMRTDNVFSNGVWQHLAVTINPVDNVVRTYKNGVQVGTGTLAGPLSAAHRLNNWMGRSGWSRDEYFQGKLDEVRLSRVVLGAAAIRLEYESQRPGSRLLTFAGPPACQARFTAPADTSIAEGASMTLVAYADCAGSFSWSALAGPVPRIVDPNVTTLTLTSPRVAGDTVLVYRFSATFGGTTRMDTVRVRVREAIPEPIFTLPASLSWNSEDHIQVTPYIANLGELKASRDSVLTWNWTLEGLTADTSWHPGTLILRPESRMEPVAGTVGLCLHNRGPEVCRTTTLYVGYASSIRRIAPGGTAARDALPAAAERHRAVNGRLAPAGRPGTRTFPAAKPD